MLRAVSLPPPCAKMALPLPGIAGLRARDIMDVCTAHLLTGGAVIIIGLTFP